MQSARPKYVSLLRHPAVIVALAIAFVCLERYLETRWRSLPFVFSVTLAMAAFFYLMSRRAVFSLYAAGTVTALIGLTSMMKYRLKGFALHYYDLVFVGSDGSALQFLVLNYHWLFLSGLLVLLLVLVLLVTVFRVERAYAPKLRWRAGLAAAAAGLAVLLFPNRPDEPSYTPFLAGDNASSFFMSFGDLDPLKRGVELGERVLAGETARLAPGADCGPAGQRPDVVMVLSESQTDPALFPQIAVPDWLEASFRSPDGKVKPLYVETFGGGTWVTNFSVMTGLSATDFGWQSAYVTQLMENRVHGSLPQLLAGCGYRTVTVMSMPFHFANEGRFLMSIGFQEIYDMDDVGVSGWQATSDRPYFALAEKIVADHHHAKDPRPLLIAVQTMLPHNPYDESRVPKDAIQDFAFSPDAGINEYMRRIASSRQDFGRFLDTLEAGTGPRGTVVLEYGDHQSEATKPLVAAQVGEGSLFSDLRSPAYRTFYTVHGFGTEIDYGVFDEPMDVGYLASALVEAAKLPSSPLMRDLADLRKACSGRFHTCRDRALVDRHLAMRVNGGLLVVK